MSLYHLKPKNQPTVRHESGLQPELWVTQNGEKSHVAHPKWGPMRSADQVEENPNLPFPTRNPTLYLKTDDLRFYRMIRVGAGVANPSETVEKVQILRFWKNRP